MENYWLIKSEPQVYSLEQLKIDGTTVWDGVRNYQARNFLRQMIPGDLAFFYHSNISAPGIVGMAIVITNNVVDPTQFDPNSAYYDPKATRESPRWYTVIFAFERAFTKILPLKILKQEFNQDELWLNRRGSRLSVMPITPKVAAKILILAN
ncbi:EVE domain-containing protein [Gloeocapsa sp. PCC 73106]|uniref:EVE domain-containing protein n=1 Tax=Gloeocapsa sp. PCC 73106 TaxID=102232 RepID=UPI0002ABE080|nr:EVE domain-containing protein [Gloeocapsa sp. PCC 73106]ELR99305.1 hypothetical protein GLO73106DRAFT_00031550 [Gloeocapsa sp. PCC 73106]